MMIGIVAIALAYLAGSIPFGFLVARWFGKVDIRAVGSGNIGATNVGRILGFRFFVVVFLLDYAKGLLPTLYLPRLAGGDRPDLPVLVAIATILGHNFPIFLGFKGGKGVATSLGAVSALDPVASVASALGFATFLVVTRFVSMSSIGGGLVWVVVHFATVAQPWARDQIAMSLATVGLMGLLIARHRKNLARLWAGTEPKVNFRKKRAPNRPAGKVALLLLVALATLGGAGALALNARRKPEVDAGPYHAAEVDRVATGHQRAERLAFADGGRLLVATCPRYNRVMLYRVTESRKLDLARDIELEGKPMAVHPSAGRIVVLVRPNNDRRHVEEGWWQAFDLDGRPIGAKNLAGFYPDDLAVTPDGRLAIVLTSGRGEGGPHRPPPALTVFDLASEPARPLARLEFDRPGDDPARLALSGDGRAAAVSIQGGGAAVAWVDLADPVAPKLLARVAWPAPSMPDALGFDHLGGLLAADEAGEAIRHQASPGSDPTARPIEGGVGEVVEIPGRPDYWACTVPFDSGVAFLRAGSPEDPEDRLPLLGRANLSATRPVGLAFNRDRSLIAVANRSGGSVHLIAIRERAAR